MTSQVSFRLSTALRNLDVLKNLKQGQKLTIQHETGVLSVHVPYRGESIGRWWSGAFNTDVVRRTFQVVHKVLQATVEQSKSQSLTAKKQNEHTEVISLFNRALGGVLSLKKTYQQEGKSSTASELNSIYQEFSSNQYVLSIHDEDTKASVQDLEFISDDLFVKNEKQLTSSLSVAVDGDDLAQVADLLSSHSSVATDDDLDERDDFLSSSDSNNDTIFERNDLSSLSDSDDDVNEKKNLGSMSDSDDDESDRLVSTKKIEEKKSKSCFSDLFGCLKI